MQLHGFERPTQDIDFLVDPSAPNIELLKQALCVLEDKAVLDVQPDDVATYGVVRVADEVVVDLLSEACGVTFDDIEPECEELEVQGVRIRVPIPEALLRTKQTVRPKDAPDRAYLEALIAGLRRTR